MPHQVNACSASFLFLFQMLLEANFLDAAIVINNERIPLSMIFRMFAGKVIVTEKAALKPFLFSAFSVLARCTSAIQAHRTLRVRKPFQAFSKLFKLERFDHVSNPIIANCVNKPLQFSCNSFYSAVSVGALTTVNAAHSISVVFATHFKSPNTFRVLADAY